MLIAKRNLLSLALASAIAMIAADARAQAAEEQPKPEAKEEPAKKADKKDTSELETVTVVGIRSGIERAIDLKLDSTSIVEAVSAEDIGKLPDASIAESIARLPGLAAQRVAGRASTIAIRGLAGDFATTLLNGREQASIGDNRGVEFDQYPSELLNAAVVYKTPDAHLVGQGLSGTIDLKTVRPLSYAEPTMSVNARMEKNSLGELNPGVSDYGNRISASYIDQFADGTIGLALGYARLDSPGQAERWSAWGYPTGTVNGVSGVRILGGSESWSTSTENVRDGFMGVLEYSASDTYSGILDVYYSQFDKDETTRALQMGLGWSGATIQPGATVVDGVLLEGTAVGVKPVLRNDLNTREDDLFAIGWNNKFNFSDNWTAEADFSLSSASREEMILETYSGTVGVTDTVHFLIDPETGLPTLDFGFDYSDPNIIRLNDSGGWGQDGYVKFPEVEDDLRSFKFAAARSFDSGILSSIDFGYNHSDREKSRNVPEAFVDLLSDPTAIGSDIITDPADLNFTGIGNVIGYDVARAYAALYDLRTNLHPDITNKNWVVNEQLQTFYLQFNLDAEIGDSVAMKGNIGVQHIRTSQDSDGFSVPNGQAAQAIPYSGGADYNDTLPSLNLSFSFPHEQVLRFGAAKQMARPRLDQMRANNNYNLNQATLIWSGGGGNPELEPWRATALDISYEKYFGTSGYVSLAAFHKDLKNYIYSIPVTFDFGAFDDLGLDPPSDIGMFTRPENGEGGSIRGTEVAFSIPFDLFSDALEGLGLVANYSDTSSSIAPNGPGSTQPLPGLSKYVSNMTGYFERGGFSTRISRRHRSAFLGEVQGFGADRALVNVQGETLVDFQIGYSFGEGMFENTSLLLQVYNVTDEPYREVFDGSELTPKMYNQYGRTFLLGATYKF